MSKMPASVPGTSMDPQTQLSTYHSYVTMLADPGAKDESKLQAAQELSENFELIISSSQYPVFLDHAIKMFLKILQEGEPHFIAEYNIHQVRKLLLEMIYRIPTNKYLKQYVESILSLTFKLLETENEQNVLVCLRIIIELHKYYRPAYNSEIPHFLQFVQSIYQDLPDHMNSIFEPKTPIRVKDLSELNLKTLLNEIYTSTPIQCEKKNPDGSIAKETLQYNLIPRGVLSLKVLQELPIIVVLMYEIYKENVHQEVNDYIPIIIKTFSLQPLKQHRTNKAFNKEVFVDFMGAQIKSLSFLAYIVRIYQEVVSKHSQQMVEGMLGMLTLCPMEVTHLRKELLIAARHILATELRLLFVPYMERLFDEEVLLGRGWTTHESLRPLAYSTLADLVHHVRQQLPMSDLVKAVHLFSKNVHDETLPTSIQTISCKLLLNLVDCIRQQSEKDPTQAQTGQDLLMRMLEVFVIKFKTIAKLQLPVLIARSKQAELKPPTAPAGVVLQIKKEDSDMQSIPLPPLDITAQVKPEDKEANKCKFGFPTLQPNNYSVSDCRSLVKTLVCGAKTITWRFKTLKLQLFKPKETEVFIRLVKWALQALDIYMLSMSPTGALGVGVPGQRPIPQQTVRTKDEKEVLEHFSGVFSVMNAQTFREIFSTTIDYLVERTATNSALQIVGNSFLGNSDTSPIFATVLVEYLLGRMEEMGNGNIERSNLYLKLFKLVFGSVSLFAAENENMLRPHLNQIVNRSMELAMTAKEPYNYFLLLRTLFRSIGGGNHDLLYQEFLPLLPNLLQGLNSLQSGLHKQHMKDLFVELCLTVPVRLSSLLPYLPMLMDPLVSALNGSHTLISQGLRTLELCVDNLQPDFLYEHIQPVRADLMQALWRSLRNPTDQVAHVAFRVLGKFGGGNRKMMIEPQKLEYSTCDSPEPSLVISFPEHTNSVRLPISKIIESALATLKPCSTDIFYRRKSWEIIRDYLLASMKFDDDYSVLVKLLSNEAFRKAPPEYSQIQPYKCTNKKSRQTFINALKGMFLAVKIKELTAEVQPTLEVIVKHFTMIAVAQQTGPFPIKPKNSSGMDPLVLIDALAEIMGHEEKELCKPGRAALNLILETAQTIVGSKDLACRLPLMEYIAERMCSLCYDRAWYTKLGGCLAIMFLFESMSLRWVYQHMFVFVKAQLFVMMDLTGEVSSGALDQAKSNLEALIKLCAPLVDAKTDPELAAIQHKALADVTFELIRQVTSPTDLIREQSMHLLRVFAEAQNLTVVDVMKPHKDVLVDMIPPKKHLLRHQAANAQIGLMEGNTFCTTLTPRLFTIDLNVSEHKTFFNEVKSLCEAQDGALLKMPCYKNIGSLTPLRKAAMRALAACQYLPGYSDTIFHTFYQTLEKNNPELQEAAFQCMKTFVAGTKVDMEIVHEKMKPLLATLADYRNVNLSIARRLSYLVQLFPTSFNEKLCEQLLQNLQKLLDTMMQTQKGITKSGETENVVATIINIFHQIPAAGAQFIEPLSQRVLQTERNLLVGASSPFRHPLMKFLLRYPQQTINLLLTDANIKDDLWNKYLEYIIKHAEGRPFRDVLQSTSGVERLIIMALSAVSMNNLTLEEQRELQFQSIRIVSLLVKYDDQWISTQHQLAQTYIQIWCNDQYLQRHKSIENVEYTHWKEPKLVVKILLNYFSHHPTNIDLLFQLLRAFCDRFLPDFQFVKEFLETTIAQSYTIEWKRMAFFRFVELFPTTNISQDLKAKILQLIIIPCFSNCFEKGERDKLIGGQPMPNHDSPDNIVSVFINEIIDRDSPVPHGDSVRIRLLQLSCLLVDQALPHIHDTATKTQGSKLRKIMTFAWPCLLSNNCVDPATRYHGHLLLSHIIAKVAIQNVSYKRIVLGVFHGLLKAHAVEVRPVVRQALEILTPTIPARMEDGYKMLTHWTKKIIVEEGHSMQQLFHILQLVVRHYTVYYPVRHALLQHMVNALQRLGFSASSSLEHKKLGCELADVIIKWELQRIKDENQIAQDNNMVNPDGSQKRVTADDPDKPWKKGPGVSISIKHDPDEMKPLEKSHADILINFLMRLACSVNEINPTAIGMASPGEVLSRRCYNLVRMALKSEVWPNYTIDFRLIWLDKIFCSIEHQNPNLGNICIGLELFTLALSVMKKEQVLAICKTLQKGINTCISSSNNKVIRLSHALLTRLMSIFPTESSNSNVSSKYEELECIYSSVGRVVFEGLANYEKNTTATSSCLFGPIMMLKAACSSNPSYVDRLINPFVRVIHRMSREHLSTTAESTPGTSDLLILSLELVKNRVAAMTSETKKTFIGSILVALIEKTPDIKIMKAICKMVEEWMRNTKPIVVATAQTNMGPSLREKSILLVKLMHYVEKRFPDLNTQFLELVNFVYRDDAFKATELIPKLEPAFLAGLRCTQPEIRAKFFEIFDGSMRRKLHDRLMYIVSSQNWEPMGQHYWIKQCIELILVTANEESLIQLSNETPSLPSITSVIELADNQKGETFLAMSTIKIERMESNGDEENALTLLGAGISDIEKLINMQTSQREDCKPRRTVEMLMAITQLCHLDTGLAEKLWLDLYPRLWNILSDRQRTSLSGELLPFIVSGCHTVQKDLHPSALSTIFEGLSRCNPTLPVKPTVMAYLGKSHNLWHRVTLTLEKMTANSSIYRGRKEVDCYEFEADSLPQQVSNTAVECLAEMYQQLREEDMWCALWQKYARYKETCMAIAYEQLGFFEQALTSYELAITKGRHEQIPMSLLAEQRLWEEQWIRCSKELNQWNHLLDYARTKGSVNSFLILESAWRIPDWSLMKDAIAYVETGCPKELAWKVHLYRGFLTICHPQEQHLPIVERYVELASSLCMREWRRLPHIVSHIHLPLLQAAQQIMELQEACQIHQGLLHERTNSLHDMKAIVKTWRNRLPIIADDLSHWSDIFTWRKHHYQFIKSNYDSQHDQNSSRNIFGAHDSAQAIIHFGKIARKHNLTEVCLDSLSRIYTIPSVPIADCFQKVRQQVKCYLQMATVSGNKELQEGLEVVESTNLNFFTSEMTSECYALKGMLLAQLGRIDEANKAFSGAVQLHDTLVKAWALWGDFIESQFTKAPIPDISLGVSAITCFLHACRHQNESKSRKYLAKVLWLLTYDDEKFSLTEAVDKYVVGVPPIQWLPWIPQLLTCLMRNEGKFMLNLLSQVGRMFPQAVYFPIRTLYLTLKIEQRERYKSAELAAVIAGKQANQSAKPNDPQGTDASGPIRATPSMWRCCRIMHMQRDTHPTVLSSLEGIVDQMVWFRENCYEEVLRQLRQGLAKCYVIAFENRGAVSEATITPHTLHFVKKLVSTFGIGIENIASSVNSSVSSSASESLAKRAEITSQDPVFQKMKIQFSADFDFSVPGAMKLQNLIHKLKKWIKILEAKTKLLPKSFLIEEKCRFLSNFSLQTAEIELPGEFLLPKHSHYYVRISRFMPRVEIVQKHNTAARRLFIRGHNGKIYPYLVVNDSGLGDARREERVLQLLRMLNHYLGKQKETSRRFLHITVPRVVAVSPQMRLVEDNPASVSLLDVYKTACSGHDIEHDAPVSKYYERLAAVQARGMQASHQILKEILKDVQTTMIPRTLLRDWAQKTYQTPTDFWTFRKMMTLQLALACFCEYVLHLTRLNPDMLYIHQDSGLLNVSYFKFDVEDTKGDLDANRPVPFRLTPNIEELLTETGVSGPLTASMIASARCLVHPNFKVTTILRAILRDEMIFFHRKKQEEDHENSTSPPADVSGDLIITMVNRAVSLINLRLNSLSYFEGTESKVSTLVVAAKSADNLCRMDPAWHPWL